MKHIKYMRYFAVVSIVSLAFEAFTNVYASDKQNKTKYKEDVLSWGDIGSKSDDPLSWRYLGSSITLDRRSSVYGFRNSYANEIAFRNLKSGGSTYDDGAVFATYLYELDNDNGRIFQGQKIKFGFMTRDIAATATGGWVFTAFDADGEQRKIDQQKSCFSCHMQAKDKNYILSTQLIK